MLLASHCYRLHLGRRWGGVDLRLSYVKGSNKIQLLSLLFPVHTANNGDHEVREPVSIYNIIYQAQALLRKISHGFHCMGN